MHFYIDIYKDKVWSKNTISKKDSERIILYCFLVFFEYKKLLKNSGLETVEDKVINSFDCVRMMKNIDLWEYVKQTTSLNVSSVYLNISYVNEKQIQEYNRQYRGKDAPTNVLSFTNEDTVEFLDFKGRNVATTNAERKILYLGDMILCYEKLLQEANEYNKTFNERLLHLFVHSIFHLFGLNHVEDAERQIMESMEKVVLSILGVVDVYFYTEKKE